MDKFVAPIIRWLQYDFKDELIKYPLSSNGMFFQNNNFTGVRRRTGSV